jgi:hypothetical protein
MDKMNISKQTALKFVILLGIVSLFGDMTYEGAQHHRSLPGRAEGQRHRVVGVVATLADWFRRISAARLTGC